MIWLILCLAFTLIINSFVITDLRFVSQNRLESLPQSLVQNLTLLQHLYVT